MASRSVTDRLGRDALAVVGLTAVAAALRLHALDAEGLWNDEFASMEDAMALGPTVVEQLGNARPLYYVLLRPWIEVFGTTEVGMRLLSVLLGVAAVPALYLLGRRMYGRETAVVAALLLAFSRFHVKWSQDVRMYVLLALLAILSYLALVRLLEEPTRRRRAVYVGVTALLAYTHLYAAFVIVAQNLYVGLVHLTDRWRFPGGELRDWIATQLVLTALAAPVIVAVSWKLVSIGGGAGVVEWMSPPTPIEPLLLFAHHIYLSMALLPSLLVLLVLVVLVAAELLSDRDDRRWDAMLWLWLGTVLLVPFVLSLTIKPFYQPRYAIAAAPATALIVGRSLENLLRRIDETFIRRMCVVGLALLLVPTLLVYYEEPQSEQWREAASFVEDRVEGGDQVVVSKRYTDRNFAYYFDRDDVAVTGVASDADADRLGAVIGRANRTWVVVSNMGSGERRRFLERLDAVAVGDGRRSGDVADPGPGERAFVRGFHRVLVYRYRPPTAEGNATTSRNATAG